MRLVIVTATTDIERARSCIDSWLTHAGKLDQLPQIIIVGNGMPMPSGDPGFGGHAIVLSTERYMGSVAAFRVGVDAALKTGAEVIACFHDDFEIKEPRWDSKVEKYFERNPRMGLAGFGGAVGLGALDMYERPYDPMSLARVGFRSNLDDADAHGVRSLLAERVACLDGFSQIGRRAFFQGLKAEYPGNVITGLDAMAVEGPWALLQRLGIIHHLYDGLLGALAARGGWETWYIPLRSKHWGGRTAVGDAGYQAWAKAMDPKGDQGFWEHAHRVGYEAFKDVLPLRV